VKTCANTGTSELGSNPGDEKETVRRLLRAAFTAPGRGERADGTLNRDLYESLRADLSFLWPKDLQRELPRLLETLLDISPEERINGGKDINMVIIHLDVLPWYDRQRYIEMSRSRLEQYELFTSEQADAVYRWLLYVRDWPAFEYLQDHIERALQYWQERSRGSAPTEA
jgi:hypothetical protein